MSSSHGQSAPLPPDVSDRSSGDSRGPQPEDREARQLAIDYVDILSQLRILTDDYRSYYRDISSSRDDDYYRALEHLWKAIRDSSLYFDYTAFADQLENWQSRLEDLEERLAEKRPEQHQAISGSLEELNDELNWHREKLDELREELEEIEDVRRRGVYDDDQLEVEIDDIQREMSQHQAALVEIQAKIRTHQQVVGRQPADPSLYRLTRSLRRELDVVSELLSEDVLKRIESNEEIEAAVKNQVRVLVGESDDGRRNLVVNVDGLDGWNKGITVTIDTAGIHGAPVVTWESKVKPPRPDQPPKPPKPEVNIGGRTTVFSEREGQISIVKEAYDSVEVLTAQPVYVVYPTGQLEVVGWQRPWVRARCDLKVSAATREKAERLVNQIEMRLHRRSDAVYIESDAPDLSDPKLKVDLSHITIHMPVSNPLAVQSSSGRMQVSGMEGGLKVNGSNTAITLDRVTGGVELGGNQADMILNNVRGDISARNAYGALRLSRCDGLIKLKNLNAEISLTNCSGAAEVDNNGPVMISQFDGPVTVRNTNGLVQIDNVSGDLSARTSLKPIYVSNVYGAVSLENTNGAVHSENIAGKLRATTSRAPIYAARPGGPVVLSNRNGNIELLLEHGLIGPSRVDVFDGLVNLRLSGSLDLLLNVESIGGQISSSLPLAVQQSGERQSASLALGDASQALNVTGTNSDVLIYETR